MTAPQRIETSPARELPDRVPVFDLTQNLDVIEAVTGDVRRTIGDARANGRLWLGSSTEIHLAIPAANVLAMWDEIEKSART